MLQPDQPPVTDAGQSDWPTLGDAKQPVKKREQAPPGANATVSHSCSVGLQIHRNRAVHGIGGSCPVFLRLNRCASDAQEGTKEKEGGGGGGGGGGSGSGKGKAKPVRLPVSALGEGLRDGEEGGHKGEKGHASSSGSGHAGGRGGGRGGSGGRGGGAAAGGRERRGNYSTEGQADASSSWTRKSDAAASSSGAGEGGSSARGEGRGGGRGGGEGGRGEGAGRGEGGRGRGRGRGSGGRSGSGFHASGSGGSQAQGNTNMGPYISAPVPSQQQQQQQFNYPGYYAGGMFYPTAPYGSANPADKAQTKAMLTEAVRKQIDYYFSVENLCKDIFLRSKMDDNGWIPLAVVANFNRVRILTLDWTLIVDAIADSPIVEVSSDSTMLRARENWDRWVLPPQQRDLSHNPAALQAAAAKGEEGSSPQSGKGSAEKAEKPEKADKADKADKGDKAAEQAHGTSVAAAAAASPVASSLAAAAGGKPSASSTPPPAKPAAFTTPRAGAPAAKAAPAKPAKKEDADDEDEDLFAMDEVRWGTEAG